VREPYLRHHDGYWEQRIALFQGQFVLGELGFALRTEECGTDVIGAGDVSANNSAVPEDWAVQPAAIV
jgi:hypothetical protein